jgi:ABC-type lipoprotein release transport system permease subunit
VRFLLTLAFKNLLRHSKRTILTVIGIAVGVALLIWMDGMLRWGDNESKRNLIRYEFGNFVLSTKEFHDDRDNLPVDSLIPAATIAAILKSASTSGLHASARTGFSGVLSYHRGFGLPFAIYAVDPERYADVFFIGKDIVSGKWLQPDSQGILISRSTARNLGVKVGDTILFETRTRYGSFQAVELKIEGLFDAANPAINRQQAFVSERFARANLQTGGAASEIVFRSQDERNEPGLSRMKEALAKSGQTGLVFATWQELGSDFLAISRTKRGGSKIMIFFIFVITAIGIVNTMLMAVFERIRELGMMRALGMRDNQIVKTFVLESAGIGLIGSLAGVALGALLDLWGVTKGLDFTRFVGDIDFGYRTRAVFFNEWNPDTMVIAFVFGILCSVLVSLWPSRKAVEMEITDAIRYQ